MTISIDLYDSPPPPTSVARRITDNVALREALRENVGTWAMVKAYPVKGTDARKRAFATAASLRSGKGGWSDGTYAAQVSDGTNDDGDETFEVWASCSSLTPRPPAPPRPEGAPRRGRPRGTKLKD